MSYVYVIQTSVDSVAAAQKLIDQLMAQELCACVQMIDRGRSTYRWQGRIEQTEEFYLSIKTDFKHKTKVIDWLQLHHPYELPEIIWTKYESTEQYGQWMNENVLRK